MGTLAFINHFLNLIAPALAVGFLCALFGRLGARPAGKRRAWWIQGVINSIVGAAVLLGGLAVFGQDGRLATYAVLVLACGTSQWVVSGGWRR
jgi:4-hydroxybenzoate polyprenyltransferase